MNSLVLFTFVAKWFRIVMGYLIDLSNILVSLFETFEYISCKTILPLLYIYLVADVFI